MFMFFRILSFTFSLWILFWRWPFPSYAIYLWPTPKSRSSTLVSVTGSFQWGLRSHCVSEYTVFCHLREKVTRQKHQNSEERKYFLRPPRITVHALPMLGIRPWEKGGMQFEQWTVGGTSLCAEGIGPQWICLCKSFLPTCPYCSFITQPPPFGPKVIPVTFSELSSPSCVLSAREGTGGWTREVWQGTRPLRPL